MDINDAAVAGISLDDLKAAAEAAKPVPLADHGRAARVGIERLEALRVAVDGADTVDAKKLLISDAGTDQDLRHAAGYAWMYKQGEVLGILAAIGNGKGLSSSTKMLGNIIAGEAKGISKAEAAQTGVGQPIGSLLAPLGAETMRTPIGYVVEPDGVWHNGNKICSAPILPLQRARDIDLDVDLYKLTWLESAGWKHRWVKGTTIVNSQAALSLGDGTHLITSANSIQMIGFFSAWLEENQLEPLPSVSRMGWVGERTFIAGEQILGDPVVISCQDPADLERMKRVSSRGTLEGWVQAIEPLTTDPVPMTLVAASLASALLRPLGAHGFLIDLWCESRRGKTTVLKVAASVWGPPDHERGPMFSWSGTQTGLQANAWFFQNLPLLLDETQVANPSVLSQATYELPNGQGKARGRPDGSTHRARTWRLVTVSTGERSANAQGAKQGAVNRCLSINRPPFGDRSPGAGKMIAWMEAGIVGNNGTLGPAVIQRVLDRGVSVLRREFAGLRAELSERLNGNPKADFVATLLMAARLMADVGVPVDLDALRTFLLQVVEGSERDLPTEAAASALEWASANEVKFKDRVSGAFEPHGGWLGWWDPGFGWTEIVFRPWALQKQLAEREYDFHSILAVWRSRHWIELNNNGQLPKKDGMPVIRLRRAAMEGKL